MLVSDAMFHANKLVEVARGQFYPLSETQHAQPFRIPYGVAFYVLLAPFARAGVEAVTLVRVGTAAAGLAASLALLLLLGRTPRLAGAAVIALQILPGTFDTAYSHGNFSNAFGQAATVAFFAWWAGRASGGFVLGALALLLAGLAHLSSLVVLCALAPALAMARLRAGQGLDRQRLLAIGVALLAIVAYYLHFWDLVLSQLPRLLEGGGQGRGASRSAWDAAWLQVQGALAVWGPPAIALAVAGWPGPGRSDEPTLDRDLRAFWLAGAVLVIPAVVSPLEVRYLYALTVPVAVAAAVGFYRLHDGGHVARAVAWVLLALQAALFGRTVAEAVLWRYGKLLPAIAFCGGVPPDTGC
jgi:hypothetical protein